jgi:hypothetical protein
MLTQKSFLQKIKIIFLTITGIKKDPIKLRFNNLFKRKCLR